MDRANRILTLYNIKINIDNVLKYMYAIGKSSHLRSRERERQTDRQTDRQGQNGYGIYYTSRKNGPNFDAIISKCSWTKINYCINRYLSLVEMEQYQILAVHIMIFSVKEYNFFFYKLGDRISYWLVRYGCWCIDNNARYDTTFGAKLGHYDNTPIQIYWTFHHQKLKLFR